MWWLESPMLRHGKILSPCKRNGEVVQKHRWWEILGEHSRRSFCPGVGMQWGAIVQDGFCKDWSSQHSPTGQISSRCTRQRNESPCCWRSTAFRSQFWWNWARSGWGPIPTHPGQARTPPPTRWPAPAPSSGSRTPPSRPRESGGSRTAPSGDLPSGRGTGGPFLVLVRFFVKRCRFCRRVSWSGDVELLAILVVWKEREKNTHVSVVCKLI